MVPFVGAGLSAFCSYPSWPNVLTRMHSNIRDPSKKDALLKQIQDGQLIEAAQGILDGYHYFLRRLPEEFSPKRLEECPNGAMRASAVWALPYLFPDAPAVTTNFDQVLETVYAQNQHRFTDILGPQQLCQRAQARQQRHHALLKLHGSIGKTIDHSAIVFTKDQYDTAYQPDSRLVMELTELFKNDTLLFLGCSLQMDRTLEVLEKLQSDGSYLTHFAILGCAPEKFAARSEQLEALGIIPIFYDDTDPRNHDSVRVILEHLLYETNPDAYQKLDDEMRRFVGPVKRDDVLMFNAGRIKYVGRIAELEALERFCSSPVNNEWWAVTGPGGMGKSRLIYEFTNKKRGEGWKVLWFSREQYHRLTDLQLPAENTIVVLDDVQADTQTAGEWLKAMRTHRRANRLRILLIEREGADYGSADWLRVLRSGNPYSDPLAQWCHNKTFLHLEPLTDEDLKAIMESCAEALGKSIDPDALLTALNRADGELRRPLYALAIAEAACGGEDPLHWDPERVLDEMLDRELAFHYESLRYVLKQDPTLTQQQELELLMAQCCIYGQLSADAVTKETYPHLIDCMAGRSPAEFFRCLGLLHAEEGKSVLRMNCPDLIKEHLVLRLAFEQNTLELLPDGWYLEPDRLLFLRRLWFDCPDRLQGQNEFWNRFFSAPLVPGLPARIYADLLWGCTYAFPSLAHEATDALTGLYEANHMDEEIAICFAKGLFNLSCDQSLEGRASTVNQLTKLYNAHFENATVAVQYAMSLFNLSCVQSPVDQLSTADRLKDLHDAHTENEEVAVCFAKCLFNMSCVQSPADRTSTVDNLMILYNAYSENEEFATIYASGLFNLSCNQSPEGRAVTVAKLKDLYNACSENTAVAVGYASGLFNLSNVQSIEDRAATVDILMKLYDAHSENTEITAIYAKGLVNLSCDQSAEDRAATVGRLMNLYDAHSENAEIADAYASGLFNLSEVQDSTVIPATVQRIADILRVHPTIISGFKEAINKSLSKTPDPNGYYQLLLELGGDSHA